jgi:hypothetical protein
LLITVQLALAIHERLRGKGLKAIFENEFICRRGGCLRAQCLRPDWGHFSCSLLEPLVQHSFTKNWDTLESVIHLKIEPNLNQGSQFINFFSKVAQLQSRCETAKD